ncbi:helix-turn-helix transcriptional regulator [Thermoproteota archaeon]
MNQKQIGTTLIIIGLILTVFVFFAKAREDKMLDIMIEQQGSCYLDDGTCLHDEADWTLYILGWVLSAALVILGVYLIFFDKTQQLLAQHQIKVSSALKEAKKQEKSKDEFQAFLGGFNPDECVVLKAVKEQDGIKQSTLRYRTGISKTGLSLMLKDFEKRHIISRKASGKTNEVFLRKKF